ncbi:hypothetical protein [Tsukamurella paurometabola]|uniref:PD-(D/E)XK endonuclease-like domain-containing protein n=1 Tax=Tsukamurella paurometabola TaxID=2061 RepID=A0ABS5NFR2_TSUPA|nr:hypothetical protein [Tsukamurella paurometabola]MBS4102442.1 hypothetical protein [Tsukamurella paurometabola]
MKFSIAGTIPTGQYANIQPTFEIEADSNDEALREGLRLMQAAYQAVGKSLDLEAAPTPQKPLGELLTCWASGTRVYFDPATHTYSSPDGTQGWLSGSAFAKKFHAEFPADIISSKMAAKALREREMHVLPADIVAMWAKKAEVSSSFGTSLHAAIELYGKYGDTSMALKGTRESVEVVNPYLAGAVRAFFDGREGEEAEYEVFVADDKLKHCGLIDRLKIVQLRGNDPIIVRVQDIKTGDIDKPQKIQGLLKGMVPDTVLGGYWAQLSFYAAILKRHGVIVEGLDIFHWNALAGAWDSYEHDVLELGGAF